MPLRKRKTEGRKSSRPIARKTRPATSSNHSSAGAAVPPSKASSASISLSESESDIERVTQKANTLLGCFLSFKNQSDDASTENISRDSSVIDSIPTKPQAKSNKTSTAAERSKKRDGPSSRIKSRTRTQSESPPPQRATSLLHPEVEIPHRTPQPTELPADRHVSRPPTRLRRSKRAEREDSLSSDRIEASIYPASRSSKRKKGPLEYQGHTHGDSSSQGQNKESRPVQPYDTANVLSHIRARELGYRIGKSSIYRTLSANENWEHWKSWKGASQDVVVLEWSPDGTRFVAGSATSCSPRNMIYNRRNNLVVGDLTTNSLKELPDHQMPRALFDPTGSANDSQLYTSISAVAWSNDGTRMFSSSYDRTVKLWDTSSHQNTKCITTLRHPGKVLVMALSKIDNSRLATGSNCENSFLLWHVEQEDGLALSSSLEISLRHKKLMMPTSLAWGVNSHTKDMLAAGMSLPDNTDGNPPIGGHLALWRMEEAGVTQLNVMPNSQNVFDISWHPTSSLFAAGIATCGRSKGLGSDIRSMVNVYNPLMGKRDIVSYDCPGIDINDVTFCPFNENYISAGCTDGTTYVWDWRNPNKILHKLKHGPPIRENDVGVQLTLWGDQPNRFYTGSSDGCVKLWNIMAATEDVFVKDIANLGTDITSGALSSDKTTMLIGDTGGSIHILSTSSPQDDDKSMRFEHAEDELACNPDSAVSAANALIESGQIVRHNKFGPGKGPNYSGPYASWARPPDTPADQLATTPLTMQVQMQQLYGSATKRRKYLDDTTYHHVRTQIQLAKYRNQKTYCAVSDGGSNKTAEEDYS
ncbi:hypothetical protein H109_04267 [Trichophyton interdigitale MR816]|uniref:Anaphase-promoting complex subunit 4 WD40 domain-containing protein n=1 Tax=Trichophyton interdigitale (strain MR816) TaxID=1215338 RepID=A0A059J829_TRIIM|nr:hypothetical protein H101_03219 [Trichophyton interdigitale H6]KDB23833.1 hypothetical protein H109_04267 [Trichophyton interdigitale MR816]